MVQVDLGVRTVLIKSSQVEEAVTWLRAIVGPSSVSHYWVPGPHGWAGSWDGGHGGFYKVWFNDARDAVLFKLTFGAQ